MKRNVQVGDFGFWKTLRALPFFFGAQTVKWYWGWGLRSRPLRLVDSNLVLNLEISDNYCCCSLEHIFYTNGMGGGSMDSELGTLALKSFNESSWEFVVAGHAVILILVYSLLYHYLLYEKKMSL